MRIALTGNPNSGKTTMFNALTGRSEKVGNWAGVTVERKEHPVKKAYAGGAENLIAVDLPGAYSMSPFTSEESVTSEYVRNEHPDVIVNIVDGTNLSRSLFFTTQLLELGIPMVVALNKADVNEKKHTVIDVKALSEKLGCPVVETVSTTNNGLAEVIRVAIAQADKGVKPACTTAAATTKAEAEKADRARFAYVNGIVKAVEKRQVRTADRSVTDKIDAVITHPAVGLVIFAAVMYFVFWFSQASFGPWLADTLVAWLEGFQGWVAGLVSGASDILQALLVDGVIGGLIAVVGFLPLVMVMYFLIALLEDCGYMARATVVLDPIFKKVGLSGKSVIPFVITTGCAIPGVMAARTIRDERERRAAGALHALRREATGHRPVCGRVLRRQPLGRPADVLHGHCPDLRGRAAGQPDHRPQAPQVLLHHRAAGVQGALAALRLQVHAGARLELHRQGRYDHPAVQYGGPDHADLRLEPAGG